MKSRMRENRTYGSVRGLNFRLTHKKGEKMSLLDDNIISTGEKILKLYEEFRKHEGYFISGNWEKISFVAPSSLHSSVSKSAYGKALEKECANLTGGGKLNVKITLDEIDTRRHYIKINCCLEQWQKLINDITIMVNGQIFYYSDEEFIENICQGWPSLYYPVDKKYLRNGDNIIKISTKDKTNAGLLVSEVCIISLPDIREFSQISFLRAVRKGHDFTISVYTGTNDRNKNNIGRPEENIEIEAVDAAPNYLFKGYSLSTISTIGKDICLLKFNAVKPGAAVCKIKFADRKQWLELIMPEIVDLVDPLEDEFLVGIDSDDHRHDVSDEADRILEVFAFTGMGNYLQFRPSKGRTHYKFANMDVWKNRVDFLKDMNIKISIADTRQHLMEFIPEMAGNNYIGSHIHEPYLFFCLPLENTRHKDIFMLDGRSVLNSNSFGESEALYRNVLKKTYEKNSALAGLTSVGSPSLLCIYEASEKFDRVTLEPVSNINLLTGAIRGVTKAPKQWGAHIPIDWYFGSPNDECKSRKFRLAMNYLYISGAKYIYTENAVFKTNAFSREDWEDKFTSTNRKFLRDFYEHTIRKPRHGRLIVNKAVVYGRHEHFFWHHDDRMAELKDMGDWDRKVWGKWEDDSYRKCWRAIDSWLPPAKKQYAFESDVNLKLFSGTPYGSVDIIPWWEDFSKYNNIAFLGWNTMSIELIDKLKEYVYNGGTLFISYCHMNTTDRNDRLPVFIEKSNIEDFLGVKINDSFSVCGGIKFTDGFETGYGDNPLRVAECTASTSIVLAQDSMGRNIYFSNKFGEGKVYFGAFMEYFSEEWAVSAAKHIMDIIGIESGTYCNNPNIAFTERIQEDGKLIINMINMNCAVKNGLEKFHLEIDGKTVEGELKEGSIYTYVV